MPRTDLFRAAAGAAGGWEYPELTNVFAWLDATNLVGVVADAATVTAWTDRIAAKTFAEATNAPTFRETGGPNGLAAVEFDGTNDHLSIVSQTLAQDFTAYAVVYIDVADDFACWLGSGDFDIGVGITSTGSGLVNISASATENQEGASVEGAWQFWRAVFNGAGSSVQVDGVEVNAGTIGSGGFSDEEMFIGLMSTGYWDGKISEVIISSDVSAQNDAAVEAYVTEKYGLTIA